MCDELDELASIIKSTGKRMLRLLLLVNIYIDTLSFSWCFVLHSIFLSCKQDDGRGHIAEKEDVLWYSLRLSRGLGVKEIDMVARLRGFNCLHLLPCFQNVLAIWGDSFRDLLEMNGLMACYRGDGHTSTPSWGQVFFGHLHPVRMVRRWQEWLQGRWTSNKSYIPIVTGALFTEIGFEIGFRDVFWGRNHDENCW